MKVLHQIDEQPAGDLQEAEQHPLRPLVVGRTANVSASMSGGVLVGRLVGMVDQGRTPLVVYPGQAGCAAVAARSVVDLHGSHVGKAVVIAFEGGDAAMPIVMGVVREAQARSLDEQPGHVEVDADGERLIVSAKEELVLRCGKASITLTKAGKVLVEGTYVSSRSSGVQRIKGGSVHIN